MNLFKETTSFSKWFFRVMRTVFRVQPLTTLLVIFMAATSRITNVLAMFIPLKVVLLAGSSGVPSYLQFLVPPDQKLPWIIGLAIGAIACYIISLVSDSLADKLSLAGSAHVLRHAQVIPMMNNQQTIAQNYYSKFCRTCADAIFVAAGMAVGFLINFWIFTFITGMMIFLFFVSALLCRSADHLHPGKIAVYTRENLGNYIKLLSSLIFLSSFVFLLVQFMTAEYSNVLMALLAFILIRQTQNVLSSSIKEAAGLYEAKHRIDALVFPNIQFLQKELPEDIAFKKLLHKQARQELAELELGRVLQLDEPPELLDVTWKDTAIPGVTSFSIMLHGNNGNGTKHFQQQVFPPKQFQKLEHESFLFDHIPRRQLKAPKRVALFFTGAFQCQICATGANGQVAAKDWAEIHHSLIRDLWSCRPPDKLVDAYCASTPLLHQCLNEDLLSWLQLAVDTDAEQQKFHRFQENLTSITKRLRELPLYIHNPDLNLNNVISLDDDFRIMTWCRWSLEPVGVGMPANIKDEYLAQTIDAMRESRNDIPANFTAEDIKFAANCGELERLIQNKRFKTALNQIDRILS